MMRITATPPTPISIPWSFGPVPTVHIIIIIIIIIIINLLLLLLLAALKYFTSLHLKYKLAHRKLTEYTL
jgi:hypothetical protein